MGKGWRRTPNVRSPASASTPTTSTCLCGNWTSTWPTSSTAMVKTIAYPSVDPFDILPQSTSSYLEYQPMKRTTSSPLSQSQKQIHIINTPSIKQNPLEEQHLNCHTISSFSKDCCIPISIHLIICPLQLEYQHMKISFLISSTPNNTFKKKTYKRHSFICSD